MKIFNKRIATMMAWLFVCAGCQVVSIKASSQINGDLNAQQTAAYLNSPQTLGYLSKPSLSWTIMENRLEEGWGHVRLDQNKWLMNFLHWRPLTEENKTITPEYARQQLLTFWGPNMAYFTLTGEEGPTLVNGHEAYIVNGRFRDVVATRFVIWNCPETGRQFTADLNINLRVNTPAVYLEAQDLMAATVCCHGDCQPRGGSILPEHVDIPDFNVCFDKPAGWRTFPFEPHAWFPDGANQLSGTLWTLVPDAGKQIDHLWVWSDASSISEEMIGDLFAYLQDEEGLKFTDLTVEKQETGPGRWSLSGHYQILKGNRYKDRNVDFSDRFLFRGMAWKDKDVAHLLLASILHVETIWGVPVDLEPSGQMLADLLALAAESMAVSVPQTAEMALVTGRPVDPDGNIYPTIRIGDLEWMAENLRTTRYVDGTPIRNDLDHAGWRNNRDGAMAVFPYTLVNGQESDREVFESYGVLYNWYAVNNLRGLCPPGWRVPTDEDWKAMTIYLIGNEPGLDHDNIGNHLKSCRQMRSPLGNGCDTQEHPRWYPDPNHYGTDTFGFGGLPGGYRFAYGDLYNMGSLAGFWSATADSRSNAWVRFLRSNIGQLNHLSYDKASGFSVRCVKDMN